MWEQRNKTLSSDTETERRQAMKQNTSDETSFDKHEKTPKNTRHAYSHTHEKQRQRQQSIPQETLTRLSELRDQYSNKIIEKRSFESSYGYCEYDVYPDEYYEKRHEILCGNMDIEQAMNYLEEVGLYSHALLKRLDTVRAFQYLKSLGGERPETRDYAERVILEYPGTDIELEARFYIADVAILWRKGFYAEKAEAYKGILEIIPNSIDVLAKLGTVLVNDDKPSEAIPYFKQVNRMNPDGGNWGLGESYEKLGDVKTAWIYYKKALRGRAYNSPTAGVIRRHIEAIEAGDPIYQPVQQEKQTLASSGTTHPGKNTTENKNVQEHTHHSDRLPNGPSQHEARSTSQQDRRDETLAKSRAAVKAAQETFYDFRQYQEISQKDLNDFLQWTETIMNADSPMDTNNFLMKEMEAHLKDGQPQFEPERIIRAFETMERYGPADGIKRLQKSDPNLAKQVQRLLAAKRAPHQH